MKPLIIILIVIMDWVYFHFIGNNNQHIFTITDVQDLFNKRYSPQFLNVLNYIFFSQPYIAIGFSFPTPALFGVILCCVLRHDNLHII